MKRFLRSKLTMTLAALVMLAGTIAISLAGPLVHTHATTTRAYAPWAQSDHDETNNRFNAQETTIGANNLNSLTQQWVLNNATIQQISQLGIAGNSVVNYGRVYVAATNGNLYGFDEQTGILNWHIDLTQYQQGANPSTLQVTNGMVYVSVDGSLGIAVFDANNDAKGLLWQTSHFSNFTVSNSVLYTSEGYAYNANNGKQLWYKAPPCGSDNVWSYLSSMSVDSSQGFGYTDCYHVATLYAFHLKDGSIAWTVPLENQGHNTELVAADGMVYVEGVYFSKLYAFNSQTGNSVWKATPAPSRAPVIANGILYMSYWDNVASASYVAAIDAKKGPKPDGSFMWKVPTGYAYDTTVANGILYQSGNSSAIKTFDAATGNSLAPLSYSTIGQLVTPITIADGMIVGYARDPSGTQYVLYALTLPGTLPPPSPSPTPTPTCPGSRQKLFVLLQGVTSTLSSTQANNGGIPDTFNQKGGIYPFLQTMCPSAKFLVYSYKGSNSDGSPQSYTCGNTFKDHIKDYVGRLRKQITSDLGNSKTPHNLDVYLVGHSLGGALSFTMLADMELNGFINVNGSKIAGVVTLDSPLGGVPSLGGIYLNEAINAYKGMCIDMVKHTTWKFNVLNDLASVFTYIPNQAYGATASLMYALNGNASDPSNSQIAENAHSSQQIMVLSIGNPIDYVYDFQDCPGGIPFPYSQFLSTQWVTDEPPNAIYGRYFPETSPACPSLSNMAINHGVVLTNSTVQTAISQFLAGQTPAALQPAN